MAKAILNFGVVCVSSSRFEGIFIILGQGGRFEEGFVNLLHKSFRS